MRMRIALALAALSLGTLATTGVGAPLRMKCKPPHAFQGPADLCDVGDPGETIGQLDGGDLAAGTAYQASMFPVKIACRSPDAFWGGSQAERGRYRFIDLHHVRDRRATSVPGWGVGDMFLESSIGETPSVAAVAKTLQATRRISAGPLRAIRLGGHPGLGFDATITGHKPGETGVPFIPFSGNPSPGFDDHLFVPLGTIVRVAVIGVRGKTVAVFMEGANVSVAADCGGCAKRLRTKTPHQYFAEFIGEANRLLSTLSFPR